METIAPRATALTWARSRTAHPPARAPAEARVLTRQTLRGTWGTVLLPVARDETIDLGRLPTSWTS